MFYCLLHVSDKLSGNFLIEECFFNERINFDAAEVQILILKRESEEKNAEYSNLVDKLFCSESTVSSLQTSLSDFKTLISEKDNIIARVSSELSSIEFSMTGSADFQTKNAQLSASIQMLEISLKSKGIHFYFSFFFLFHFKIIINCFDIF